MSLFVDDFIIWDMALSVLPGGNAGRNPLFQQAIPEPVSVIASIRKKMFGSGEIIQQFSGSFIVRHLARRQIQEHRFAGPITNCM
jgi:hypothetical protein